MTIEGFQQVTGLSSAKTLTVPAGTQWGELQVVTQNCRIRFDGTAPTSSVGEQLTAGGWPRRLSVEQLEAAKIIEETASATAEVHYYS